MTGEAAQTACVLVLNTLVPPRPPTLGLRVIKKKKKKKKKKNRYEDRTWRVPCSLEAARPACALGRNTLASPHQPPPLSSLFQVALHLPS